MPIEVLELWGADLEANTQSELNLVTMEAQAEFRRLERWIFIARCFPLIFLLAYWFSSGNWKSALQVSWVLSGIFSVGFDWTARRRFAKRYPEYAAHLKRLEYEKFLENQRRSAENQHPPHVLHLPSFTIWIVGFLSVASFSTAIWLATNPLGEPGPEMLPGVLISLAIGAALMLGAFWLHRERRRSLRR
jgi:hypothetical protein